MYTNDTSDTKDTNRTNINIDNNNIVIDNISSNEDNKDINKEKKESKEKKERKFVKPTIDEVAAYCKQRGNTIDPEAFVDFYESKGWMVGSNHMKDWRAAVRTWERKEGRKPTTNGQYKLGVGEWINQDGIRTYGSGRIAIPMDATPRPGNDYCWDAHSHNWIVL